MQKSQKILECLLENESCSLLVLFIIPVESALHKLDVPVAVNIPDEFVYLLTCKAGLELFKIRSDLLDALVDLGQDPLVLIAEDSTEIRLFLNDLFRSDYNVLLASDGLTAEDQLKLTIPDLVLSDVIMPGKTGYGLCADIKASADWNHIPVVLLTAKADAESSVEGMKAGADAYISKPFDPDVLKATVESILRNRRILQQKVRDLTGADLVNPEKTEEARLSPADSALLRKVQDRKLRLLFRL